jgi:hypothetical protein
MSNEAVRQLGLGQVASIFGIIAVASQFAETLVSKKILTVAEAQSTLSNIAEELRNDGDAEDGKYAKPAFVIANELDQRAIDLGRKFPKNPGVS